jgi:hypothetical protein
MPSPGPMISILLNAAREASCNPSVLAGSSRNCRPVFSVMITWPIFGS